MAGARVRRHGERGSRLQPRRGSVPSEDSLRVDVVRALVATRAETPANKAVPNYEDGAYDSGGVYPIDNVRAAAVRAQVGATRSSRSRGDARPRQANVRAQRSVGDDGTGPRAVDGETSRATPVPTRNRSTTDGPIRTSPISGFTSPSTARRDCPRRRFTSRCSRSSRPGRFIRARRRTTWCSRSSRTWGAVWWRPSGATDSTPDNT